MLIKMAPSLKGLSIIGLDTYAPLACDPGRLDVFANSGAGADPPPILPLLYLRLCCIDLTFQPFLYKHVDVLGLRRLHIVNCVKITPFLQSLAPCLARTCNLVILEIVVYRELTDLDGAMKAIETLLKSTISIRELWLDLAGGSMVDVSTICRHGATLSHLGIMSGTDDRTYLTLSQLATALTSCVELTRLAINFCPIDLGNAQAFGSDVKLQKIGHVSYVPTEAESFLVNYTVIQTCLMPTLIDT